MDLTLLVRGYSTLTCFLSCVERYTLAGKQAVKTSYYPHPYNISKYAQFCQLSAILSQNWANVTTRGGIQVLPDRPTLFKVRVEKQVSQFIVYVGNTSNRSSKYRYMGRGTFRKSKVAHKMAGNTNATFV